MQQGIKSLKEIKGSQSKGHNTQETLKQIISGPD